MTKFNQIVEEVLNEGKKLSNDEILDQLETVCHTINSIRENSPAKTVSEKQLRGKLADASRIINEVIEEVGNLTMKARMAKRI